MKLYEMATGNEITNVTFFTVNKRADTGGQMSCFVRDQFMANYATYVSYGLLPMEVRKNDGSTVLWEGILTHMDTDKDGHFLIAKEFLTALYKIAAKGDFTFPSGVVSDAGGAADDYITDATKIFAAVNVGRFVGFSHADTRVEFIEHNYNPSASAFYYDGAANNPADDTGGTYTNLGGSVSSVHILDGTTYGDEYYGIDISFTIPDTLASIKNIYIKGVGFFGDPTGPSNFGYGAGAEPNIYAYDEAAAVWRDALVINELSGVGRIDDVVLGENSFVIRIQSAFADYIDGSNILKIRVVDGLPTETNPSLNKTGVTLKSLVATVELNYAHTTLNTTYTIDVISGDTDETLEFTDQTPYDDGVRVNDSYFVQDTLSNVITEIWNKTPIITCDLSFAASSKYDSVNRNGQPIGRVLSEYAKKEDRYLFQKVGWSIECPSSLVDTTYNLTESNFLNWKISNEFEGVRNTVHVKDYNKLSPVVPTIKSGPYSPFSEMTNQLTLPDEPMINDFISTAQTALTDTPLVYRARADLDEGTWTNIDICKTIDLVLYTNKETITAGVIIDINYSQKGGGHLHADMEIKTQ